MAQWMQKADNSEKSLFNENHLKLCVLSNLEVFYLERNTQVTSLSKKTGESLCDKLRRQKTRKTLRLLRYFKELRDLFKSWRKMVKYIMHLEAGAVDCDQIICGQAKHKVNQWGLCPEVKRLYTKAFRLKRNAIDTLFVIY